MLHLEGLRNAVDIVCYEKEKIQSVTNEWMMSCGVSLFMHWGNTCTHHTSNHDHIHSYYSCHGNAGASFQAHPLSRQPSLYYSGDSRLKVLPNDEVCYPQSYVTVAAAVT